MVVYIVDMKKKEGNVLPGRGQEGGARGGGSLYDVLPWQEKERNLKKKRPYNLLGPPKGEESF